MADSITVNIVGEHVEIALNEFFSPLAITECFWVTNDGKYTIDYSPPFYLESTCAMVDSGIHFNGPLSYPLECTSYNGEPFIVQNADDWINHAPKFVHLYDRYVEIMQKMASAKN